MKNFRLSPLFVVVLVLAVLVLTNCARMGRPDGGWYDETPPHVIGANPADRAANAKSNKVEILFDEYIKVDNPTENVIISPPQNEQPEIKAAGKKIVVELKDTLKENTTYTVDFSDAITDNNESNPLGNYTYSFSTGATTDTLEVAGHVLNASDLEPVKGVLVGLYEYSDEDTIFTKTPFLRVARTNSEGYFVIKGVKEGKYRVFGLKDQDNNYMFSQKSEMLAFNHDVIEPSVIDDTRLDTVWKPDHLHFDIARIGYRHFLPDNITLRAFTETLTNRYLKTKERKEPDRIIFSFSYGDSILPVVRGLNFDDFDAFYVESNLKNDSIIYWLRDTSLINQDTLNLEVTYNMTDSLGKLVAQVDTFEFIAKPSYEKRMKEEQKKFEDWFKKEEKKKKKGQAYDSIMPKEPLKPEVKIASSMSPVQNPLFTFPTPLAVADTSKIHVYEKVDSLWYDTEFEFQQKPEVNIRTYQVYGEWKPGREYSLELDSAAFVDIYGNVTDKEKKGFKIKSLDEYGTFTVNIPSFKDKNIVVQLLDNSGKVENEVKTSTGQADFYYLETKSYYMKMFVDDNNNGVWDTGEYSSDLQPEEVYYYPKEIECQAKRDLRETWNPKSVPLIKQKPEKLVKQKAETKKKVQNKNYERAKKLGIELPSSLQKSY